MFSLTDLPPRWTARATEMRFLGQEPLAKLIEALLGEFETELAADATEPLTIAQAANESGYSEEHLRRLVREEQIPSAGRPNSPRIRRADVPIKPGHNSGNAYPKLLDSKEQIARCVANSERGESDD